MTMKSMKKIFILVVCFLAITGFQNLKAMAAESESSTTPESYQPQNETPSMKFRGLARMAEMPKILLIEDVNPWSSTKHIVMLQLLGEVDKISSSQVLSTELQQYDIVILSNDQISSTYQNYTGFKANLEEYVKNGGFLLFGACDQGWNAGSLITPLPGEVKKIHVNESNNKIADFNHPIVTGELTNQNSLTDGDLHGNYCSHTSFEESTLPVHSKIILRDPNGNPTLVEYPLGNGVVMASGLTWEHNLEMANPSTFSEKALKDLYVYLISSAAKEFFFDIASAAGSAGDYVDVMVSMKNNPGISGFSFGISFNKEYLEPVSITATGSAVSTLYSNLSENNADISALENITAVWSNASNVTVPAGDLFTLRFKIKSNAYTGKYPITLSGMAVNELFEELDYNVRQGNISVADGTDVVYGDIYTDGHIDIKDAVKLSQFLSGRISLNTYEGFAADVQKNDRIDVRDAIKLSQYLAGYENIILGSAE